MRRTYLAFLLAICACDSPTEPIIPPSGEYALVAIDEVFTSDFAFQPATGD